ncbi:MAG: hypothetical protein ACRCS3_04925 [Paracoccaceae bacterium]
MRLRAGALVMAGVLIGQLACAQDLIDSALLGPDIAALPRLAGGGAIADVVNAQLQTIDESDLNALSCVGDSGSERPSRRVEVLSAGPEFLSFLISKGAYCAGAAHPSWSQRTVNFDLQTGEQTNLRAFMPRNFTPSDQQDDPLAVMFLNTIGDLPGDCVQAYARAIRDGHLGFELGLAKSQGALMLWPDGLAHVHTPCLDMAYVPLARLQEAGFDARILKALSQP